MLRRESLPRSGRSESSVVSLLQEEEDVSTSKGEAEVAATAPSRPPRERTYKPKAKDLVQDADVSGAANN